ncbi:hypothetical protein PDE_08524 [Penicillium oxalicum 114-2]|uniref:Uncharacterized protein n=1 Tax=Penicillium oxalicum (strain 114-2 / CGMCC 5302) TaxID=933388 RepID=S8BER6_PENO1|nr:hypothetical protein PDE_08524 [Penicillium oxalicum 114-2]
MFDFSDDASHREKCYTTISQLPRFVDPNQVPRKRSPFSTILNHAFVHTVEVILEEDMYAEIQTSLGKLDKPRSARVFMSPSDLLEHEFFNTYIKTGNVMMISEGQAGSDTLFTLNDGILRIELGREKFERVGLSGKPVRSGGRKHTKERFLIELNLRLPSMLHGKKGFDRIVWAFKNVLDRSVAWLFCDLDSISSPQASNPIEKQSPQWITPEMAKTSLNRVSMPPLEGLVSSQMAEDEMQQNCGALSEWIGLTQMRSPRISADDQIDPYLSRYEVPGTEVCKTVDLVSLKWHGLIPAKWILDLYACLLSNGPKASHGSDLNSKLLSSWFVLAASTLRTQAVEGKDGFTIVTAPSITLQASSGEGMSRLSSEADENPPLEAQNRNAAQSACYNSHFYLFLACRAQLVVMSSSFLSSQPVFEDQEPWALFEAFKTIDHHRPQAKHNQDDEYSHPLEASSTVQWGGPASAQRVTPTLPVPSDAEASLLHLPEAPTASEFVNLTGVTASVTPYMSPPPAVPAPSVPRRKPQPVPKTTVQGSRVQKAVSKKTPRREKPPVSQKITWDSFLQPVVPEGVVANPGNHGRWEIDN